MSSKARHVAIASRLEQSSYLGNIFVLHGDVQVGVSSRLLAEQRIDRPPLSPCLLVYPSTNRYTAPPKSTTNTSPSSVSPKELICKSVSSNCTFCHWPNASLAKPQMRPEQ